MTDGVGYVPIFPVIVLELTAPATVIPEPARTAKSLAEPRSTMPERARWGANAAATATTAQATLDAAVPSRQVGQRRFHGATDAMVVQHLAERHFQQRGVTVLRLPETAGGLGVLQLKLKLLESLPLFLV